MGPVIDILVLLLGFDGKKSKELFDVLLGQTGNSSWGKLPSSAYFVILLLLNINEKL